jgi:DNA-binding MarR family transcriptional regulator
MIIREAGFLMLGSRLKRLGDRALAEVREVYKAAGVDFEISWFPVFYVLQERGTCSIQEISENLEVSHSAISQLVSGLEKKGLIQLQTAEDDQRKKEIHLTDLGKRLMTEVTPIWRSFELALSQHMPKKILSTLDQLEQKLDSGIISTSALELLHETTATHMEEGSFNDNGPAEFIVRYNLDLAENDLILLIKKDQDIIGMLIYYPSGEGVILRDIFVEPMYRRRGHALSLLNELTGKYQEKPLLLKKVSPALLHVLSSLHHPFTVNIERP